MSMLATYNGLQIPRPEPGSVGGKASADNFKKLSTVLSTLNPSTGNDSTEGFGVGSRWINTATNIEWICTDPTATAAVWQAVVPTPTPSPKFTTLFTHYTDAATSGGAETTLYSDTIPANTLANPGDRLDIEYSGYTFHDNTTAQLLLYFGGGNIINPPGNNTWNPSETGDQLPWTLKATIINVGDGTVRYSVVISTIDAGAPYFYTLIVAAGAISVDTSSDNDLVLTGIYSDPTGGPDGNGDGLVVQFGGIDYKPAP